MNENNVYYSVATISDRGLSQKRPLNEDSFFTDPERGLFAVADGVGGANAGEVASSTAMEVLSEAFRHHIPATEDEELMELAIQKANSSIYQMAREHPKLSMMATTIAALHLDGMMATIGHVGDSRIYRLTPGGKLYRETRDHSVVEEEVRAGRMTPEQALYHPSRNVISRALGAEETVEVDMKTIEVVDGTTFLLCSDGITRHISDDELRELIVSYDDLDSVCQMLKSLCYERGAEDNLTAVIVRVKGTAAAETTDEGVVAERTISTTASAIAADTAPLSVPLPKDTVPLETAPLETLPLPETAPLEPSHISPQMQPTAGITEFDFQHFTEKSTVSQTDAPVTKESVVTFEEKPKKEGSFVWSAVKFILVLILLLLVAAGAFFAGMKYQERSKSTNPSPQGTVGSQQ
jgi:protein phosphatase